MQDIHNRATRNLDLKALRRILTEALPAAALLEHYEKAGLAPGNIDPSSILPAVMAQALANEFFKSEGLRTRLAEALQDATAGEQAALGRLSEDELLERLDACEPEAHGRWIWVLSTHEKPAFQTLAQELLHRKSGKTLARRAVVPLAAQPIQEPRTADPSAAEPQDRKTRKLQGTLSSLQKEIEKLRQERVRGKTEVEELRVENENLRRRLQQAEGIDELRARLEQVDREKEHVIYELNRKTHELHQLQKKYEIFNRLDTEVLILRSKVAKILNDAIVERKRFAQQLASITDSNLRSLEFYRDRKDKNLGPPDRTPGHLRVGVFVDVQNMFYAARNKFNGRLDYQALLKTVVRGRKLVKANAYIIQTPDIDQSNFILLLEHCGYEVHSKYLRTRYDGSAKGDWDMEIAIDIISMIGQLDVVILVSGDGDFVALVKMVQRHGLEVEVHSFEHNTAVDLREAADRFYPINEDLILH
jgi:uncharacterized LabA/DUF88 family protein/archaellum component FlaC